jgi:CRP-like cAMP-binding protein
MKKNFFNSLAPAESEAFTAVAVEKSFPRGSQLMSEGDQANYVMVIRSGWTRITVRDNGGERVVAERGPGQLVGERAALRRNIRSATVTALDEVTVLAMKTVDFASFIDAHPRVLDVVENQIYDRLLENPEGYAQDGWPGALSRTGASRALHARLQSESLRGENCTVLLTDVVGFGALHRTDYDRRIIRREGLEMMQESLGPLWEACISQDRGDGLLIVAPPQIPTVRIIERINRELPDRLRLHNRTYSESARFHLRVGTHVGPVVGDHLGVTGETIIRAARLVEAPVLKETMAETGTGLGIIVSEFVYEIAIAHIGNFIDAAEYTKVDVSNKEFRGSAWVRLMNVSPLVCGPLPRPALPHGLESNDWVPEEPAVVRDDLFMGVPREVTRGRERRRGSAGGGRASRSPSDCYPRDLRRGRIVR